MRELTHAERSKLDYAAILLFDAGYPTQAAGVRRALDHDWDHRADSADASDELLAEEA